MSTQVHAYGDASNYLPNPSAYSECYWRGANTWKDAAKTVPADCQKFFLEEGVYENWQTLAANIAKIPMGVRIGFRIIDFNNPPVGWKSRTIRGFKYPDLNDAATRAKYRDMLIAFKKQHPRITWVDIPFPYGPSNEPSITEADCKELGGGTDNAALAKGKAMYFEAAKWIIDLYVEVYGRAVVGNLGGSKWIAEVLLPYQKSKGVRAFRQDSWMYFDWRGTGPEGENRERLFDPRIAILGGRDSFDRLILEQTGNGLVLQNGVFMDQSTKKPCPVWGAMMGEFGEFEELEATDWGNMGLKAPAAFASHPNAAKRLADWYSYVAAGDVFEPGPSPDPAPGDGGTPDPTPGPVPVTVRVEGGWIRALETTPAERPKWAGAIGEEVYTFTSIHPARVDIQADREDWEGYPDGFLRWSAPDPQHNLDVLDNPAGSFRTDNRGTDITVRAVYEDEPIPDPEPPAPIEYVTREEFDNYVKLASEHWSVLLNRIKALEAHNDSWGGT